MATGCIFAELQLKYKLDTKWSNTLLKTKLVLMYISVNFSFINYEKILLLYLGNPTKINESYLSVYKSSHCH